MRTPLRPPTHALRDYNVEIQLGDGSREIIKTQAKLPHRALINALYAMQLDWREYKLAQVKAMRLCEQNQ